MDKKQFTIECSSRLNSFNLKQATYDELQKMFEVNLNISKIDIAEMANLTITEFAFDYSLPQAWFDNFYKTYNKDWSEMMRMTTFTLYSCKWGVFGVIWSACKEIDDEIVKMI